MISDVLEGIADAFPESVGRKKQHGNHGKRYEREFYVHIEHATHDYDDLNEVAGNGDHARRKQIGDGLYIANRPGNGCPYGGFVVKRQF